MDPGEQVLFTKHQNFELEAWPDPTSNPCIPNTTRRGRGGIGGFSIHG
jgi:hypothetical protein